MDDEPRVGNADRLARALKGMVGDSARVTVKEVLQGADDITNPSPPITPGMKNPMITRGDMIKGGDEGVPQRLGFGTAGYVLVMVGGVPVWTNPTTLIGTHTHTSTDVSDFAEATEDRMASTLVAGSGVVLTYDDTANTLTVAVTAHTHTAVKAGVTAMLDGGGSVITIAQTVYAKVPFACIVKSWEVVADAAGSITVLVARAVTATPTSFTTISGTSPPTLSTQATNKDTVLPGDWSTVSLNEDDWLRFTVSGTPALVKLVGIALDLERTVT